MRVPKKHARHFVPHTRLPLARSLLVVGVFFVAAFVGIQLLRAAGHIVSSEAESGTVAGNAAKVNDSSASNGKAVRFGGSGDPSTPSGLITFTGGTSIALRWNTSTSANGIKQYNIYRNGSLVDTVTPTYKFLFPEKDGNGYIDTNVTPGTTYNYQVQAVSNTNATSTLSSSISARHPTSTTPIPNITYDVHGNTALEAAVRDKAIPFLKVWYPKASDRMAFPDYTPTTSFHLDLDPTYTGLASTDWNTRIIRVNADWAINNQTNSGYMGMYLHESIHLIQHTTLARSENASNTPPWLREGLADWTREYMIHDRDPYAPRPDQYYTNGYSQGAYFADWLERHYDSNFIRKAMIDGNNNAFTMNNLTFNGKNVSDVWDEMTGQDSRTGKITGSSGMCLDTPNGTLTEYTHIQIWSCTSGETAYQTWTVRSNGSNLNLLIGGMCLDVNASNVRLYRCNSTGAQQWQTGPNNSLKLVATGQCLQVINESSTGGTGLTVADCNGSDAQRWTLPD
jgi:hypothetical protein